LSTPVDELSATKIDRSLRRKVALALRGSKTYGELKAAIGSLDLRNRVPEIKVITTNIKPVSVAKADRAEEADETRWDGLQHRAPPGDGGAHSR
jgi:hypothetical protein